jgi:hypothetical protein
VAQTMIGEDVKTAQREVQRLLGRCMLLIQQYERLMKALVSEAHIEGSETTLEHNMAASRSRVSGMTLGMVANELFESVFVREDARQPDVNEYTGAGDEIWSVVRFQITTSAEDHEQTVSDAKDIVQLRNHLVHHFLEDHDLWSMEGCAKASEELIVAFDRIKRHFDHLACWAKNMERSRHMASQFLQSDAGYDLFFNGIRTDGTVHWPRAGIVSSLREAEKVLSEDGWTSVNTAAEWITKREPGQRPSKYGCTSWRQVLHESQQFDLCKRDVNGQRTAFYRTRPE